ncbi:MAG: hypothetical protein Edafosvirus10_29 [Edafosvirus sp.]|uniref:Uncharacterized protein n=1 Tax=Edafosvirus sp. TaxID=2487765 RepID=A0A3G4ZVI3_9VIRU|nr:MAG: hypothetical protein Edafosvirus10_29 [Edafosvirus sp.]
MTKLTFRSLLASVSDEEVIACYKKQNSNMKVPEKEWFDYFRKIESKDAKDKLEFRVNEKKDLGTGEPYNDISGFSEDGTRFACDLTPWDEIMTFYVNEDDLKKYGKAYVTSLIITDITFHGWTQKTVEKVEDHIVVLAEEVKKEHNKEMKEDKPKLSWAKKRRLRKIKHELCRKLAEEKLEQERLQKIKEDKEQAEEEEKKKIEKNREKAQKKKQKTPARGKHPGFGKQ